MQQPCTPITAEVLINNDRRLTLDLELPPDCPTGPATMTLNWAPKAMSPEKLKTKLMNYAASIEEKSLWPRILMPYWKTLRRTCDAASFGYSCSDLEHRQPV
jgi:hypothetical protein